MEFKCLKGRLLLAGLVAGSLSAVAAEPARRMDLGKREYDSRCASCHGIAGKGDGINRPFLTKSPSDLTQLAKQNGGVFPISRVYEVIDGRREVPTHGSRDMPVWGREYSINAAEYYIDVPYDSDAYVRSRILSLIDYIYRLQQK